jgi:tRNA1Val (adenine37-N6)-methyltransferase
MANSWFQFKQFLVRQNQSAMKVTTDACLFGAWVTDKLLNTPLTRVLDIGSGTGLLSLMIAQKIPVPIDAVEIDEPAFQEARENTSGSAFRELISVHHGNILQFDETEKYDLIISNPPFFARSLRSPVSEVNLARHEATLTLEELFSAAGKRLRPNGYFALLVPWTRLEAADRIAAKNTLRPICTCSVRQTEKHNYFRAMIIYGSGHEANHEEIVIREEGQYSSAFINLLKDYYLHL